jgi:hypothetical protein
MADNWVPILIVAVPLFTTAIVTIVQQFQSGKQIKQISQQVTTLNDKSIATILDDGEVRRILLIPASKRTAQERLHLASMEVHTEDRERKSHGNND